MALTSPTDPPITGGIATITVRHRAQAPVPAVQRWSSRIRAVVTAMLALAVRAAPPRRIVVRRWQLLVFGGAYLLVVATCVEMAVTR